MKKYLTTALFVIFLCIITVSMCGCSLFNKGDESKSEEVKIESEEVIDSVTGKNIFLKAVSNTCYATDVKVKGTVFGMDSFGTVANSVELVAGGSGKNYKGSLSYKIGSGTQQNQYVGDYGANGYCFLVETKSKGEAPFRQHQIFDDIDDAKSWCGIESALVLLEFYDEQTFKSEISTSKFEAKKLTTKKNEISYVFNFDIDYYTGSGEDAEFAYTVTVKNDYVVEYTADITVEGKYPQTVQCEIAYGKFDVNIPESLDAFYFE